MSDVDAVIELLEQWRDATGLGRLRIGIDASRVIADLSPERKRALAVEVAERVAPQLVPAIESESGDLTAEQVGALVDLLRRADREQLDDLVSALREGDLGEAAELVGEAVDVVAPEDSRTEALLDDLATEDELEDEDDLVDEDLLAPPPVTRAIDETDEDAEATGDADVDRDDVDDDGAATIAASAAAAAAMADRDLVDVTEDGDLQIDEAAVRERVEAEARARAEQYRDTSATSAPAPPAYRAPEISFTDDLDLPDPRVESVPSLHRRMAADEARGRLAAPPVSQVVASLTATPDGYRRRRDAVRAIQDGRLEADDVPAVVRSFARATDRSWVAGAAVDAGLLGRGELEGLGLGTSAIARLERRAH